MKEDINSIQDEIIEEFGFFDEWMEKYEHIISYGKGLAPMDEALKTDDNLVQGCQSRVWMHASMDDKGLIHFTADSDAVITKGIAGLMVRVLSGHSPTEVTEADLYFIDRIGLKEHLSPNRANGLVSMIKKIKMYALAYRAKSEK